MDHSVENAYLASKCGYFLTFSYNPDTMKFNLNSKNVDFDKYDEFLSGENRYANLKKVNSTGAKELLDNQKEWAMKRYEYYKRCHTSFKLIPIQQLHNKVYKSHDYTSKCNECTYKCAKSKSDLRI